MKQYCKLCNDEKEYKNLQQHLKMAHNMTMEEYSDLYGGDEDSFEEVDSSDSLIEDQIPKKEEDTPKVTDDSKIVISNTERKERIFDEPVVSWEERTIKEFLDGYDMTEEELMALVRKYKTGSALPVNQQIEQKMKLGEKSAEKFKDQNYVETHSLEEAEVLTKNYNFKVLEVRSGKGTQKKTWVLRKV